MTKQLEQQAREAATKPARETELLERAKRVVSDDLGDDFADAKSIWIDGVYEYMTAFAATEADRAVERIKAAVEALRAENNLRPSGGPTNGYDQALNDILAEIAKEQQ